MLEAFRQPAGTLKLLREHCVPDYKLIMSCADWVARGHDIMDQAQAG